MLGPKKNTETRIACSLNWPPVKPFVELQFLNLTQFTSSCFGMSYALYPQLTLFGFSRNNFEAEEYNSNLGLDFRPSSFSSLKMTYNLQNFVTLLINHRFNDSMAVVCKVAVRPPSDEIKPIDVGIGLKIDI